MIHFLGFSAEVYNSNNLPNFLVNFHKEKLIAVMESQSEYLKLKSPKIDISIAQSPSRCPVPRPICSMVSSKIFNLTIVLALLISLNHTIAEVDSPGYHGEERDALLALKAGFNNSFLNSNWTGIMCYENVPPYWYGIQCSDGRVTGISLESLNLNGQIKVDLLANLTELLVLSLKNNQISGNMMDFTFNTKLTEIDLSGNRFRGGISMSLINLNSLESLQLQQNNLTGPIPGFDQPSLKTFNVSYNDLSGPIPDTLVLKSFNSSSYEGNHDLCGPTWNKTCSLKNDSSDSSSGSDGSSKKRNSRFAAILLVANAIFLVVILFLFIIYFKKYRNLKRQIKLKNASLDEKDSSIIERYSEKEIEQGDQQRGKLMFMQSGERFELEDLLKASAEGLGKGNFGNCYKAMLEAGQCVVVKRLRDLKPLTSDEFTRHLHSIANQNHPNLLPLVAYFYTKEEKLLLYRLAPNGNLYNRLHGGRETRSRVPFRWTARLTVARGVARALDHLHATTNSSPATAPHGNLKSSNVLLDENDEALVTDYGLTSILALPIAAQRMVAYKSPEYQSFKKISKKSDVWSYGCLLLEMLTGRIPAHSAPAGVNGVDLCSWVHRAVREEWTAEVFDQEIAVQRGANQGMLTLLKIAIRCCEKSPEKRPEMAELVREVESIKVVADSEDDEDYSLTDDSYSSTSFVTGDQQK